MFFVLLALICHPSTNKSVAHLRIGGFSTLSSRKLVALSACFQPSCGTFESFISGSAQCLKIRPSSPLVCNISTKPDLILVAISIKYSIRLFFNVFKGSDTSRKPQAHRLSIILAYSNLACLLDHIIALSYPRNLKPAHCASSTAQRKTCQG